MSLPRFVAWTLTVGLVVLGASLVAAQTYPNKPVRIVTAGVGGGSDFASRLIAQGISGGLGQQVIVDNRPSGVIPGEVVAKAAPDGYTLLVSSNVLWLEPYLHQKAHYDALRDFLPITAVGRSPNILVVHPSLPVKSVKDLIALAKARPGAINYAAGTIGGSDHLATELFKSMAGVDIVRVSYKNAAIRMADLIGGHVQLTFGSGGTVASYVKSGRLRALAVTSAERSPVFPDLPTVAASGLPGYEAVQILGLFAPAKTPAAIIDRVNQETVRAINEPDVKDKFLASGIETAGGSPEQFAVLIKSDSVKWAKVFKDAGVRAE